MWILSIVAVFIILNASIRASENSSQNMEDSVKDKIIYERFIEMDKNLKSLVDSGFKMALPYVLESSEHLNLSSHCVKNLFTLMSDIKRLKLSALKLLDASGKIPSGLMTGYSSIFGDYDECLTTEVLRTDGKMAFRGQYCMLDIRPVLPKKRGRLTIRGGLEDLLGHIKNTSEIMQYWVSKAQYGYAKGMKYGICIPSGCTAEDVTTILNYFGEKALLNATVDYCNQQQKLPMHSGMLVAIVFFSVIGLLTVIGSFIDHYSRRNGISLQRTTARYLMCFSVLSNFPKVINTKTQDTALTCVFGIRTLSLFYIILLHQYFDWILFHVNGHVITWEIQIPQFFSQIPLNGLLSVEVFFFLGGLVNMYSRMKIQEGGKPQPSVVQMFIHRLWRIYPTYIFSMLTLYLFVNVRGPLGTHMKKEYIETCGEKWWKNILFINNFFNQDKLCMVHTWYIAADMQLFFISLFTVPVLLKSAKKGIILHVGVLIAGLVATILWALHKKLMPSNLPYYVDQGEQQIVRNAYVSTLPHVAPYFIGIIVGYMLTQWNKFKIPKVFRYFGWLTASVTFISMLFTTKIWNSGVEYTLVESAFYFAFCRFLFVSAVAWMVICCARGYGGIINYICSLKIWIPFARISYMVYMISPILQWYYYATLRMNIDVDYITLIWRHIGDLGVSCLMGLVMVVVIESPFISMEKLIFNKSPAKQKQSPNNLENSEKHINNEEIFKEMELKEKK